jgi:hypothetical protein
VPPVSFRVARVSFYKYIIYKIDRRVSRLRKFLLTGILPYTGFTFDLPKHQSYIYYILLYYTSDRAANPKVLFVATPRHYFTYALSIYISPITYIQAHRCVTFAAPEHQFSIYISPLVYIQDQPSLSVSALGPRAATL